MTATAYEASSVQRRRRRTDAEIAAFHDAIFAIVETHGPCSVRHVFYQAVARLLVDKDGAGSRKNEQTVGRALNDMRESGRMPFTWITDNTRSRYQVASYASKEAAARDWARTYRRDLWRMQARHVEVWVESDSIAGVIDDLVCETWGLALLPCRGQAPKRFVWDSAQAYAALGKPVTALYIGDFDPNGLDIGESLRERLARYSPDVDPDVEFIRLGITAEQVRELGLTGHGLNPNIGKAQRDRFFRVCDQHGTAREAVEAEAMDPSTLRGIVDDAIRCMVDPRQWELELAVEEEERLDIHDRLAAGGWSP